MNENILTNYMHLRELIPGNIYFIKNMSELNPKTIKALYVECKENYFNRAKYDFKFYLMDSNEIITFDSYFYFLVLEEVK